MDEYEAMALAAAAKKKRGAARQPQTNGVDQFGSGINEGLAGFAGTPVDLATTLMNGLGQRPQISSEVTRGPDGQLGVQMGAIGKTPGIEGAVGGGEAFRAALDPLISGAAPQNMVQRFARRAGQEVGFGVPAALTGAAFSGAARANMPAYMATSAGGDAGAALAGQTATEMRPNDEVTQIIASMLGAAGGSAAVGGMMPRYSPTPSREAIGAQADEAWDAVRAAPERLTDVATDNLRASVRGALPTSQMASEMYPEAFRVSGKLDTLKNPSIYDVSEMRRMIGDRIAGDPKEASVGMQMKAATEDYLKSLTPADVSGANPGKAVDDLSRGLDLSARGYRADAVLNKEMRGETRAATTGTGGNEVNATRQNIRALFDKARDPTLRGKSGGFKPDEMQAMERVVKGTPASNVARMLGRLAPTSGALPMMATGIGGASGATAAMMGGPPLMAVPAIAGGVGMIAKSAAEGMTKRQIDELMRTILGGKLTNSTAKNAANAAIIQQLLSTAAAGNQQ